jgi:MFS family permease
VIGVPRYCCWVIQSLRKRFAFLSVLKHRDYRIYYLGLVASVMSHQGMMAAQGWLVFDITGEPLTLGLVGAAQAIPGLVFNLVAGALADRFDPRRMIMIGEGAAALLISFLAVLVFTDVVVVWHIIVIAFFIGVATSFDQPARRVVWPSLIPRSEFLAGTALNQGAWNGTRVIGPGVSMGVIALVGFITGDDRLGAATSFTVIAAGFATMSVAITFVHMPEIKRAGGATVFHDIVDGLAFVAKQRIFLLLLGLSFSIGYFGLSYQQLMPAFAKDNLGLGPEGVGALYVASGIGGVSGIVIAASYGSSMDRAKLIGGGATLMGLAIIGFGISGVLGWALLAGVLSAAAGALYSIFQIGANTLLNLLVPVEYRGRVMGLRGIMWSLSPLGALQAGFIAGLTSTPFAIGVGGVGVLIATGLVFGLSKQVRNADKLVTAMEAAETLEEPKVGQPRS